MRTATIATAVCLVIVGAAFANEGDTVARKHTEIPPQRLETALQALAQDRDLQVVCRTEIVGDLSTRGARGNLTRDEALRQLLTGTGLTYHYVDDRTVTIVSTNAQTSDIGHARDAAGIDQGNVETSGVIDKSEGFLLAGAAEGDQVGSRSEAETQEPDSSGRGLQEVVVTAQKRGEQSLIETPISVGVLDGDGLENAGTTELAFALNTIGGVNLVKYSAGQSTVSVRGVASENRFAGGSPTGYYLDEAAFGFIQSAILPDTGAYDLERVEVLRGPQGTLYGANSLNGVVRVISKDADLSSSELKTRAIFSGTKGGGENYGGDIAINVPLVRDKLAVRAVISYHDEGGWIDSPAVTDVFGGSGAEDINSGDSRTYRLKLNAAPTDRLTVELGAWLSRVEFAATNRAADDGNTILGASEVSDQDLDLYTLELGYDFGSFDLVSATGYTEYVTDGRENIMLSGVLPLEVEPNQNVAEALSQEIRLVSKLSGDWQWSTGAFYRDLEETLIQGAPAFFTSTLNFLEKSKEWALFGELTRRFWNGRADVTAGLRYYETEVSLIEKSALEPRGFLVNEQATFDTVSPRIVVTYRPNDAAAIYGSVSKGFRPGFIQDPNSLAADPTADKIARQDSLLNYEIGAKGMLADTKLAYEAAIYYIDWTDIQQRSISPIGTTIVRNTGDASGFGTDLTLTARPLQGLTVAVGLGWNGLEIDDPVSAATSVLIFEKGDRINRSPEYTAGLTADYLFPLGYRNFDGRLVANLNYNSSMTRREFIDNSLGVIVTESDDILNSRLSISVEAGERWGASLFVNNLLDEDGAMSERIAIVGFEASRLQPRTIGVQFNYSY